jgi:hypothetical protein
MTRHYRKRDLAARYGVTPRTIDYMLADGRLPAATFYLGRLPVWTADVIEQNERAATARRLFQTDQKPNTTDGEAA